MDIPFATTIQLVMYLAVCPTVGHNRMLVGLCQPTSSDQEAEQPIHVTATDAECRSLLI